MGCVLVHQPPWLSLCSSSVLSSFPLRAFALAVSPAFFRCSHGALRRAQWTGHLLKEACTPQTTLPSIVTLPHFSISSLAWHSGPLIFPLCWLCLCPVVWKPHEKRKHSVLLTKLFLFPRMCSTHRRHSTDFSRLKNNCLSSLPIRKYYPGFLSYISLLLLHRP